MTNPSKEEVKVPAGKAKGAQPEAEVLDSEFVEEANPSGSSEGEASQEGGQGAKDAQGAQGAQEAAATPEDLVAAAQAEAADWQGKYLRLHAEWDTYRRRMKEQREEEKARATEKLVEDIIPVLDDFERTITYATENGEEGLLGGVTAVQNKLSDVLAKAGVEAINPVGQPYEALEAQAVGTVENPSVPDETVEEVFQKGYRMGNKVIRPAMVTVSVGGPKRETEEKNED